MDLQLVWSRGPSWRADEDNSIEAEVLRVSLDLRIWKEHSLHNFEIMTQITYMMTCLTDSNLCPFCDAFCSILKYMCMLALSDRPKSSTQSFCSYFQHRSSDVNATGPGVRCVADFEIQYSNLRRPLVPSRVPLACTNMFRHGARISALDAPRYIILISGHQLECRSWIRKWRSILKSLR